MPYADDEMMAALQAAAPEGVTLKRVHYSLGSEFDKFFDFKYLFEPMPKEMVEEYNRMHEEAKPVILQTLLDLQAGRLETRELDFKDSRRAKESE